MLDIPLLRWLLPAYYVSRDGEMTGGYILNVNVSLCIIIA